MPVVVIINKRGALKEATVADCTGPGLAKRCGCKDASLFVSQCTWEVKGRSISLWGGTESGRAGSENKYDLPPPADNTLLFGSCCLVAEEDGGGTLGDLTVPEWKKIYEGLFGGFEDIGDDEEESEDELAAVPSALKTSEGYLKDDFVVATSDQEEMIDGEDEEEEETAESLSGDTDTGSGDDEESAEYAEAGLPTAPPDSGGEEDEDNGAAEDGDVSADSDDPGEELQEEPYFGYSDEEDTAAGPGA